MKRLIRRLAGLLAAAGALLMTGGATVLFVSHNIEKIKEMCDHVVWLKKGKIVQMGDAAEVCEAYMEWQKERKLQKNQKK